MTRLFFFIFCFCIPIINPCYTPWIKQTDSTCSGPTQDKPNILFIVSEDNGPEIGCYGAPVKTPNLDKLAKEGILFLNSYVPQAGCSQSRAAFLTGLYPHQNGQIGLATWKYQMYNPDTPNIPKSLKAAGYTTGIIGKLHVNPGSAFPFDFVAINKNNFARKNMEQYASEAEKFMTKSDKPFYLQVNYPDAHAPFIAQVDGLPEKPLTGNDVDALPYMVLNSKMLKDATANYYNCMMRLDTYIGDLINALKESGKYNNTLIVYIGDHGADILRGKRTSYEGGVRIPMIISWPGVEIENTRLNELANTIDLYPTFLEAAGLPVPEYLPGKSLLPLLEGKKTEWRTLLFTEYHVHSNHNPYPQRTVRNKRYKLIWNPLSGTENPGYEFTLSHIVKIDEEELLKEADPKIKKAYLLMKNPPEYELYDLETDPYEMKNLSDDKDYKDVFKYLKEELRNWQQQTDDPLIDKDKARQLFEMIQKTGTDKTGKKLVPYQEIMNPKMKFKN
jgi:N-sulfoglucosamine sulfohydrolase